jgi:flagellin-like protein
MKHTTYDKRKGISSILGTIIFIGIVFSTIVPMNLVMKQADNIYERTIHEVKMADLEKTTEELMVYAYGVAGSTELSVYVINRGANEVTLVRVWLNDDFTEISQIIAPKAKVILGPYDISETESPLRLKVTTKNGNVFMNSLGSVYYSEVNGWYVRSYAINVMIMNTAGQYQIIIEDELDTEVGYYQSSGTDHIDIQETFLVANTPATYDVVVKTRVGGGWQFLRGPDFTVQVPPLNGNPIVFVVVDGTQ